MNIGTRRARKVVGHYWTESLGTKGKVDFGDGIGVIDATVAAIFVRTPLMIGILEYQVVWSGDGEDGIVKIYKQYVQSGTYAVVWDEFDGEEE